MADKIIAKYRGQPGEHFTGIPARDLGEADWAALTDEQKALLAADPPDGVKRLYELRHDAPAEAEQAAQRVERVTDTEMPAASERRPTAPRREQAGG